MCFFFGKIMNWVLVLFSVWLILEGEGLVVRLDQDNNLVFNLFVHCFGCSKDNDV